MGTEDGDFHLFCSDRSLAAKSPQFVRSRKQLSLSMRCRNTLQLTGEGGNTHGEVPVSALAVQ